MATNTFPVDLHRLTLPAFVAKYGGSYSETEFAELRARNQGSGKNRVLYIGHIDASDTPGSIYSQVSTDVITYLRITSLNDGVGSTGHYSDFRFSVGSYNIRVGYGGEFTLENLEIQTNLTAIGGTAHTCQITILGYSPAESTST